MKKFISLIATLSLLAFPCALSAAAIADDLQDDTLTIAVTEDFGNLDILSMTERTSSSDWVFTMIYDRLLYLDNNGEFQSDLATGCYYADGSYEFIEQPDASSALSVTPSIMPMNIIWEPSSPFGSSNDYEDELLDVFGEDYWEWDGSAPGWSSNAVRTDEDPMFSGGGEGDPIKLVFKLNEDALFQNGAPVTSSDIEALVDFAQAQPHNTLIYKQWEWVNDVEIFDDYTFAFTFITSDKNYSIMDAIYSLATPMASIVRVDGDENEVAVGSGAYEAVSVLPELEVVLSRNDNWWMGQASSEEIKLIYAADTYTANLMLESGEADFAEVGYDDYSQFLNNENNNFGYTIFATGTNPQILMYNPQLETNLWAAIEYSLNIPQVIDSDLSQYQNSTNDSWEYLQRYDNDKAQYFSQQAGNNINVQLLATYENEHLAILIKSMLSDNAGINTTITCVSESDFETQFSNGNYDIAIVDVDLYNVNSIYTTLNGAYDNSDLSYALDLFKNSANHNAYSRSAYSVQEICFDYAYIRNLGWQTRYFAYSDNISFTLPAGLCPTGDIGRFDFRYVTVNE